VLRITRLIVLEELRRRGRGPRDAMQSNGSASTPVVVFGHVTLRAVYPQWGWGTQDGQLALSSRGAESAD
jgi:hypothetical protein